MSEAPPSSGRNPGPARLVVQVLRHTPLLGGRTSRTGIVSTAAAFTTVPRPRRGHLDGRRGVDVRRPARRRGRAAGGARTRCRTPPSSPRSASGCSRRPTPSSRLRPWRTRAPTSGSASARPRPGRAGATAGWRPWSAASCSSEAPPRWRSRRSTRCRATASTRSSAASRAPTPSSPSTARPAAGSLLDSASTRLDEVDELSRQRRERRPGRADARRLHAGGGRRFRPAGHRLPGHRRHLVDDDGA